MIPINYCHTLDEAKEAALEACWNARQPQNCGDKAGIWCVYGSQSNFMLIKKGTALQGTSTLLYEPMPSEIATFIAKRKPLYLV